VGTGFLSGGDGWGESWMRGMGGIGMGMAGLDGWWMGVGVGVSGSGCQRKWVWVWRWEMEIGGT